MRINQLVLDLVAMVERSFPASIQISKALSPEAVRSWWMPLESSRFY